MPLVLQPSRLMWARLTALVFTCVAFSVASHGGSLFGGMGDLSVFCWAFSFAGTLLVLFVELMGLQSRAPVSWTNFPITFACYAALLCLSASIIFPLYFLKGNQSRGEIRDHRTAASVFSCLATLAYLVEMICDADCIITNVEAKWPGSVHDSRIFRASSLSHQLAQGQFSGVLLGDKGYACLPYLLTPYQETQTEAQHNYNIAHARTRACIEMAFGLIKSRFQCLNYLRVIPQRACDIVVACVVLHNIACLRRERQPRMVVEQDWDIEGIFDDNEIGRVIRDSYANNYFG
ncbi:uncharacterized protein myadma isoform X2 [Xyrauchen texanus]|uniref:uncharacterized protein myadma isoform X2 n=1 Tax=Xyrauchen texanus TaxID=154827 RepID=UPI002241F045|nr:uncharacterized protein myadma isoform X2 [Xyrauchen texanus]